ncbi:MAG: homoserine dehydrogenase [Oscillospiraceae bacterium]|nr:homoserine dehydrogenase [Oscillospiraceae bacterium]
MIKIALLGCGTVASGVVRLLRANGNDIAQRLGDTIEIKRVLELNFDRARACGVTDAQLCSDYGEILRDDEIKIVVELIGGTTVAYEFIKKAMENGKSVVTANKDLIALRFSELSALAQANSVDFCFEASVGGGIPVIAPLRQSLAANRFEEIVGILNGTTNYILTQMTDNGMSYADALAKAQELGYAEHDPTADVEGLDAARKIAILATLAFNTPVRLQDVHCEGITMIEPADIAIARSLDYVIKLVAVAKERNGRIEAYVRPAFVPKKHPIAGVNDVFNAVFLRADAVGGVMLYGRGAGSLPTASSVLGDVMDVCRNLRHSVKNRMPSRCYAEKPIADIFEIANKFYVRMLVEDRPNVLAGIAKSFGEHSVSLASLQQRPLEDGCAELVLITHVAAESSLRASLDELMQKEYVHRISTMVCVNGTDIEGEF